MNISRNNEHSVTEGLPGRRYRFTDADGRAYAPFRLRPGFSVRDVIAQAFPDEAHDTDWTIEKA